MDSPVIGIKIANGTYFPILNSEDKVKKRVILTPVAAGQTDVKIDIFRGDGEGMFNPVYVASLILNNIGSETDTATEIELLIGLGEGNILDAEAYDRISGEKQLLSISMDTVDETDFFDIPDEEAPSFHAEIADDFDAESLDEDFSLDDESFSMEDDNTESSSIDDFSDNVSENDSVGFEDSKDEAAPYLYNYEKNKSEKRVSALKMAIVFLSIVFLIFLVLLIFTLIRRPAMAEEEIKEETRKEVVIETKKTPAEPVAVETPSAVETPAPVEKKEEVVKVSPAPKTVKYRIKRGDTLWDISAAYYRTPWRYKKLAKDNNIKNPDKIYTGTYLNIKE